jgi:Zn-dependent metalloprotease
MIKRLFTVLLLTTATAAFAANPAADRALKALAARGLNASELAVKAVQTDVAGTTHVRFDQRINGVRVFGQSVVSHETRSGQFQAHSGSMLRSAGVSTNARLSAFEASAAAVRDFGWDGQATEAELVVLPRANGNSYQLAYRVDVTNTLDDSDNPRREMIFIDAHNGATVNKINYLQTTNPAGSGKGFYAGAVSDLAIQLTSGVYYLQDNGPFAITGTTSTTFYNARTTDLKNRTNGSGTVYTSSSTTFGTTGTLSDRASIGVDAHWFSQKTLEYFYNNFGRKGVDNAGNATLGSGYMLSRTHYGRKYNNAFWNGSSMTYGDGDGTTYRPFDALDVVAHEMTHGVTERTSDLIYQNESGAANESFSDIFGVAVEFAVGTRIGFNATYPADWWIGEDLFYVNDPSNPTRGIRNMADPHIEGDPCHYTERYTGTSDNGGVHINSGIQNKVFYLLVVGGTNHKDTTGTTVSGVGLTTAQAVAFDADTLYCTPSDTYQAVSNAWINAAKNRYGAGSSASVQAFNAWKACGVTPTVAP